MRTNFGQEVTIGDEKVHALSMRDMYDLFKYSFFPAVAEENLLMANAIEKESMAMTGLPMKKGRVRG